MSVTTRYITLLLINILVYQYTVCQDTILIDSKIRYSSLNDTHGVMLRFESNHFYRTDYSREAIKYYSDSARVEFCFYYDDKRFCEIDRTILFKNLGDSILEVSCSGFVENWYYKKINDTLFKLTQYFDNLVEIGYSTSLLPLNKLGKFQMINMSGDTVWQTSYEDYIIPQIITAQQADFDSTYVITEEMPRYDNKEMGNFHIELLKNMVVNDPFFETDGICSRFYLHFIINKNGEIKNVSFIRSCGSVFTERAILIALMRLKKFEPAKQRGVPVDIEVTMPILIHYQ